MLSSLNFPLISTNWIRAGQISYPLEMLPGILMQPRTGYAASTGDARNLKIMDNLPLHPGVVHIPVGIAIVLPVIAMAALAAIHAKKLEAKTWIIILVFQAAALAGGAISYKTGEQEEDRVEQIVPEASIHEHEELAEMFMALTGLGVLASLTSLFLLRSSEKNAKTAMAAATLLMIGSAGAAVATGHEGGELVYKHGAAGAYAAPASNAPDAKATKGEEEDEH